MLLVYGVFVWIGECVILRWVTATRGTARAPSPTFVVVCGFGRGFLFGLGSL